MGDSKRNTAVEIDTSEILSQLDDVEQFSQIPEVLSQLSGYPSEELEPIASEDPNLSERNHQVALFLVSARCISWGALFKEEGKQIHPLVRDVFYTPDGEMLDEKQDYDFESSPVMINPQYYDLFRMYINAAVTKYEKLGNSFMVRDFDQWLMFNLTLYSQGSPKNKVAVGIQLMGRLLDVLGVQI